MGLNITARDALQALAEAKTERGGHYVYEAVHGSCRNWHHDTDEPGCIVGLAMIKLGVSADIMREYDTGGVPTLRDDLRQQDITMDDDALALFQIAQIAQDRRAPWGAAVAAASVAAEMLLGVDGVDADV